MNVGNYRRRNQVFVHTEVPSSCNFVWFHYFFLPFLGVMQHNEPGSWYSGFCYGQPDFQPIEAWEAIQT